MEEFLKTHKTEGLKQAVDDIQAAWGKKRTRRTISNKDLLPLEKKSIQDYIETLPNDTDSSTGLWHIVSHNKGKLKGKRFVYKFNTSLVQYSDNRQDGHDGFEIVDKRDISSITEEQFNILENGIKNRENIDSLFSQQGTWNEKRGLFGGDVIVDNRQTEGNNDRLDKQALQGETNGRQSNRNSRENSRTSEIDTFTTSQEEIYGFVDKEGNIYPKPHRDVKKASGNCFLEA